MLLGFCICWTRELPGCIHWGYLQSWWIQALPPRSAKTYIMAWQIWCNFPQKSSSCVPSSNDRVLSNNAQSILCGLLVRNIYLFFGSYFLSATRIGGHNFCLGIPSCTWRTHMVPSTTYTTPLFPNYAISAYFWCYWWLQNTCSSWTSNSRLLILRDIWTNWSPHYVFSWSFPTICPFLAAKVVIVLFLR